MSRDTAPDDELRRLRAEVERLRADNERLADLLDMAQDFGRLGVWERDPHTLEGRWDAHVFRFFGYEPGETPNFLDAATRLHPDDRRPDEVRATLQTPGNHESRLRVLRPDGTVCHLHSHWRVVADADGRPLRVIGVMVDDTATRERAENVQAEQAQLELALALSRIGLWRHDLRTNRIHFDERAQSTLGRRVGAEGVSLETLRSWIHPGDWAETHAAFDATLAGGGPIDTQTRYRHHDGQWRTILTRRLLMRDALGAPSMLIGVGLDVTEQQRRADEARALTQRLEHAAEATRVGLWSGAIDARRPEWNAQMWTLLGRDRARPPTTLGETLREYTPAEDRDRVAVLMMDWLRGAPQPLDLEVRMRRDDGELRWMHLRAQRETDADGVDRAFGVMMDVTERRDAMERLRLANERTSLALSAVGMGTWSQTAHGDDAQWDEQMFRLRGLQPAAVALDTAQRCAMVLPEDRPLVAAIGAEFITSTQPISYEFRIRRADDGSVRTLASRSVPLTDSEGRVTRRIGINWDVTELRSIEQVQRERELALRESRAKSALFARFSHELRTPLNAVLGFTQLMQSEDAQATPAQRQERLGQIHAAGQQLLALVNTVLESSDAGAAAPGAGGIDPSLLYIEDNEVNMLIVRELLSQRPQVRFHGAGDGASGVRAARELQPGLVLIDMHLPDIDGTEVLRRLRADPLTASLKCVALSANAMPEDVAAARAAGFDDYWTKPIEMATFLRAIDRFMA